AQWEVLQKSAELAQLQTKADPTVGISAGRTDRENVVGITFSIPLYIRNNFSAQARAANQIALSAEARYLAVRRQRQYAMESAQSALREYQIRFERWQSLVQDRGDRSAILLVDQWQSGDISTTEYLLALQQLSDGLSAGIELQTRFQLARIRLLLETGRVGPSMTQPTQ
ncbi:MAG: transporter, partial [Blastopirellula sp.]